MAALNANQRFAEKKAATQPAYALPKNVREALCIDKVHPNGIFKIEPSGRDALYDRCYVFEDVNYINKDEDKKTTTLLELMKLFKTMQGQFKITIANEQRDVSRFLEEIYAPRHAEEYPVLEEGVRGYISQKMEEGTRDIKRLLLLTVTCRASSFEEAGAYFATLDTSLQFIFLAMESRIRILNADERLALLARMLRAGEEGGILPEGGMLETDAWKNQIMPAHIVSETDHLKINRRLACVLFAQDYDQTLDEEKVVYALTDTLFPSYITLDVEPIRRRVLKNRLMAAHTNNEKNIAQERSFLNKNGQYAAPASYALRKKKEELENLMDQVDDNDEEAVFLGMLVMVTASSMEELEARVDTLQKTAVGNGFTLQPYFHRQLKALNTVIPAGGRQVNHMRSFLTTSAAAFQPFYAKDLQEAGGYVYGKNKTTKRLLRGDRKNLPAPHGCVIGHSGAGKSFLIKQTEVVQTLLLTDDNIILIDPKNEQADFVKLCGGQYFDLTPQCGIYLNPFEVPAEICAAEGPARNMFIARKVDYAESFAECVMTNITVTQLHMNYMERAVHAMYEEYFSARKPKRQPDMVRLREILIEQMNASLYPDERKMILEIASSLEKYTTGVYDMFAHPSNLDLDSRLVGFGLHNIPESLWEPAMLTVMHYLEQQILYNQETMRALHLVVDETQYLCARESTAEQLLHAVETYRSYGVIITLAMQNLTRVLENEKLRDMFSNCPYKCFLDQGGIDAVSLAQIQELSAREYAELSGAKGQGVMVWDKQVYLFDCRMDDKNVLYQMFNTNFHEKAEEKNADHDKGNCLKEGRKQHP